MTRMQQVLFAVVWVAALYAVLHRMGCARAAVRRGEGATPVYDPAVGVSFRRREIGFWMFGLIGFVIAGVGTFAGFWAEGRYNLSREVPQLLFGLPAVLGLGLFTWAAMRFRCPACNEPMLQFFAGSSVPLRIAECPGCRARFR